MTAQKHQGKSNIAVRSNPWSFSKTQRFFAQAEKIYVDAVFRIERVGKSVAGGWFGRVDDTDQNIGSFTGITLIESWDSFDKAIEDADREIRKAMLSHGMSKEIVVLRDRKPIVEKLVLEQLQAENDRVEREEARPYTLPVGWRSDAPIVRMLAKKLEPEFGHAGVDFARRLQTFPLVKVNYNDLHQRYFAGTEETKENRLTLMSIVPTLRHRLWDSCVIDLGQAALIGRLEQPDTVIPSNLWVLCEPLTTRAQAMEGLSGKSWKHYVYESDKDRLERQGDWDRRKHLHLEIWLQWGREKLTYYRSTVMLDDPWGQVYVDLRSGDWNDKDRNVTMKSIEAVATTACLVLAHLGQAPEYLIEVKPPRNTEPRKARDPKPWTRTDLPYIIMVDPSEVHKLYPNKLGGHHASPKSHPRRGATPILRATRFYRWVDEGDVVPGSESFDARPEHLFMKVEYQTRDFISGVAQNGHFVIYKRLKRQWQRIMLRTTHRRPTHVGFLAEWEKEGRTYRVVNDQRGEES